MLSLTVAFYRHLTKSDIESLNRMPNSHNAQIAPRLTGQRAPSANLHALKAVLVAAVSGLSLMATSPGWAQIPSPAPTPAPSSSDADQPLPPGLTGAAWNIANQAYAAYTRKDYKEAIRLVREAQQFRPDSPQLWLLMMDALEADGRLAESVAVGNEALAAGVKDAGLQAKLRSQKRLMAQAPSLASNLALTANNPALAIKEARAAVALVPDDISYHMLLIYALIADGKISEAEKAASDAVALDPEAAMPKVLRGYLLQRLGQKAEANTDFDAALKDEMLGGETERDIRIIIADAALAAGDPNRALAVLEPLERQGDPGVSIRREAAEAQIRDPALLKAQAQQVLQSPFRQCVDTPYGPSCSLVPATTPPVPGSADAPGVMTAQAAFDAYRAGQDAQAEKLIREAIRLNPKDAVWQRLLLDILERSGKFNQIDATLKQAIEQTGNDPSLVALRDQRRLMSSVAQAIQALEGGQTTQALEIAKKAVSATPASMPFRILLIQSLLAANQPQAAFEATQEALKQDPADRRARILLASQLEKQGKQAEAAREFAEVLKASDLTDVEALNYRLIAANAAIAQGDGAEALALLAPLKAGDNTDVKAYRQLAERMERGESVRTPALVAPSILCQPSAYGIVCGVYFGAAGVRGAPGFEEANAGFIAMNNRDFRRAVVLARKAVALDPANAGYRQLLASALIGVGQFGEAERILNQLLARTPKDAALLMQRGSLRQQTGQYAAAIRDFRAAIATGKLPPAQARMAHLSVADAALQAKDPELAIATLQAMGPSERDYGVQSRLGYAWLALENREEALQAFELAARAATDRTERNAMLAARINVLVAMNRQPEALALFQDAYQRGDLRGMNTVDLAVMAGQAGEDELAFKLFAQANDKWQLRGTNLINAAYNARRTFHNEKAVDYLKAAIDEHRDGKLELDPQYLFGLRREVETLTRQWGAYLSVSYGSAGVAPNSNLIGPTNLGGKRTVSIGAEIYWRPPHIGYRDGAIFDVFARGFMSAYDENSNVTGADSFQPSVGVRWKPIKDQNLVLEASYLFPVSKFSREDWLLRVGYSKGEGGDLRVDVPEWENWAVYGDFAYFLMTPQTIATFDARYGRSYRLDPISNRLVATAFIGFGGSYDTGYETPFALGIGPGVNLRYWFNEDEYTAPRSYLDMTAQYRLKLTGDDRAEGLFASAFLSY